MKGRIEHAKDVWFDAHQELRVFLETWCHVDKARAVASATCGLWVRHAMDGRGTQTGPYGLLYGMAFETAKLSVGGMNMPTAEEAEHLIPMDITLLPYRLDKLYVDAWKAAQLLKWDRGIINRATRAISALWPTSALEVVPLTPDMINPAAPHLARCAFDVLSTHECLDCGICTDASLMWETSDRLTEEWFAGRRLARKEE